jgi:hypothetical protein
MVSVVHELLEQPVLLVQPAHDGARGPQKEFRHLNHLNQVDRVEKVVVLELQIVPSIHHMENELDVSDESIIVGKEVLVQLRRMIGHVNRVPFLLFCKRGK